jgi:hypothetical protein
MTYTLTITRLSAVASTRYDTALQAMDAADHAAAMDGLTARYGSSTNAGFFVDHDQHPCAHFTITREDSK